MVLGASGLFYTVVVECGLNCGWYFSNSDFDAA